MIARLRRNDLVFHGAVVFAGLIVANMFNYLYYMLAGRVVGVEAYGELTSLTSAMLTLAAPANVAQIIVARLAAEFDAAGDRASLRRLTRVTVSATVVAGGAVVAAGILLRDPLGSFFHVDSPWSIIVTAVGLGGYALLTVQRGVLQGAHRFGELSASYCVEAIVRVATGIPLAAAYGALGGLAGMLIGVLACLAYNFWVLHASLGDADHESHFDVARIVRIAWRIGIAQLTLTVLAYYDVVVVRHVFDARSAGLYAAAALVGRATLGVLAFVPTLVMPKATARANSGVSALPLLGAGLAISAGIAAIGILVATIAPGTLAAMFAGRSFHDAAPIVLLYVLAACALGLAGVVVAYQIGLHRYAFILPAGLAAIAEVTAVALWHPSLGAVVGVLLAGHAAVLAASFVGVGGTQRL